MHPDIHTYMVQSHIDDLRRGAIAGARRAEARRAAAEADGVRRSARRQIVQTSTLRRMVTRFAL